MIRVKFGGDWPWGPDEVEECVGWHDAAHVILEHGAKSLTKFDYAAALQRFAEQTAGGTVGKLLIRNGGYIEVMK